MTRHHGPNEGAKDVCKECGHGIEYTVTALGGFWKHLPPLPLVTVHPAVPTNSVTRRTLDGCADRHARCLWSLGSFSPHHGVEHPITAGY